MEQQLFSLLKISEVNLNKEEREMYACMIQNRKGGVTSLKPAYAEWYFGQWRTEKDWEVIEIFIPIEPIESEQDKIKKAIEWCDEKIKEYNKTRETVFRTLEHHPYSHEIELLNDEKQFLQSL